jgi:hypothetical protein
MPKSLKNLPISSSSARINTPVSKLGIFIPIEFEVF